MQKVDKRRLEHLKIVVVGLHVVGVNVGHHRHHRQQVEERCVRLVRLNHDVITLPQPCVGARAVEAATDDKRRVEPGFRQDAGHQTGGGGLAVCASNRNALFKPHQLGQHDGPRHDGNVLFPRSNHLGVVLLHGGGRDHRVGIDQVAGLVTDIGLDAQRAEAPQRGAVRQV